MAEEVVYADLQVAGGRAAVPGRACPRPRPRPRRCPRPRGRPGTRRWALALAGYLLLAAAVAALAVLAFRRPPGFGTRPGCGNGSAEELASELRRRLCPRPGDDEDEDDEEEGGARPKAPCVLCPRGWSPHGAACYRLSDVPRPWDVGARDCAARAARLLGPRDLAAAVSLESVAREQNPVWIGLRYRPDAGAWLWPDGSAAPRPPAGPRDGRGCGVLKRNRADAESCRAELKWVCRRPAVLL